MPGYRQYTGSSHLLRQNPVLVRQEIPVSAYEPRQMCDAVGDSPARSALLVEYGEQRAHVQTHLNAHIENAGEPQALPRVKEAIRHMVRLETWIEELRGRGLRVTVSGDFNWAWSLDDTHDWAYSPEAVFKRLGMTLAFDLPSAPAGGTLGSRRIDYFAFAPEDLTVTGQRIVAGEHSDHRWVFIQTAIA